jgi:hypothetical protein
MAKTFTIEALMGEDFKAGNKHVGDKCFICEEKIKLDEEVRYYGGDFVMHAECIKRVING